MLNRADRMLAALADGRPHTRQDIQFRKGYFLTNNAASELRKRGRVVNHWREGRVDYYQLGTPLSQPGGADNRDVPTSAVDMARTPSDIAGPSSGCESGAARPSSVSDGSVVPAGIASVPLTSRRGTGLGRPGTPAEQLVMGFA